MSESHTTVSFVPKKVKSVRIYARKKKPSNKPERALLYGIWYMMRDRCHNPRNHAFARYGGRGITVCKRWESLDNFLDDMGPRPSIFHSVERRDNDGPYEPLNCTWAVPKVQTRNKKSNRWITYENETLTITDMAAKHGMNYGTLYARIVKYGWDVARAIEEPSKDAKRVMFEGQEYSLRGLAKHIGMSPTTLLARLDSGQPIS